jgi:hypothetical protein
MEFILNNTRQNKLNIFYFGIDKSHCSSCWESSDEEIYTLITSLSLDDMITKLKEYLEKESKFEERFSYEKFLLWVNKEAELYQENDGTSCIEYFSIFFDLTGRSYSIDFINNNSKIIGMEYNCEEDLSPNKVLESDFWLDCSKKFEENKIRRIQKEELKRQIEDKAWELVKGYNKELENYNHLKKLKKQLGGTAKLARPQKPNFNFYFENNNFLKIRFENKLFDKSSLMSEIFKITKGNL